MFVQEKYVDMFFLLLESLHLYGNVGAIVVYTSTPFMNKMKQNPLGANLLFEINDTYDDIPKAAKARLDFFYLKSASKFDKVLYLDTDIVVKGDVQRVFRVCQEDVLYVLEEGKLTDPDGIYGGKTLFGDELGKYADATAFTSGILLFRNGPTIKNLFDRILEDMLARPANLLCMDQPYIVYNAFKYNLYNNQILKTYAVNNDANVYSSKVIHHFPGGIGNYKPKLETMTQFLNELKARPNPLWFALALGTAVLAADAVSK